MKVIPAIDIRRGKVVRLTQGAPEEETVYYDSPAEVATMWTSFGACYLHVVDLDGAIEGELKNFDLVKEIVNSVTAKVEFGGGLRSLDTIDMVLDAGIDKVVIGTKALEQAFLEKLAKRFKDRIVVGIDARDGFVFTKGWAFNTKTSVLDLVATIGELGIKTINYTDIVRDGTLGGPNLKNLEEVLHATSLDVVAGGGISTIEDVKRLKALEKEGLAGIILGKALYEKTIDLREAIKICSNQGVKGSG